MAEYIERDMLLKLISHKPSSPTTDREDRLIDGFISAVKNCPAADVRPVVRGKWKDAVQGCHDSPHVKCSVCGEYYWKYFEKFNFCPNCGAYMKEE